MEGGVKMKHLISLVIGISVVLVSFIGCQKSNDEEMAEVDLQFSFWSADGTGSDLDDNFESPVAQKIKELTGVSIDLQYVIGDVRDRIAHMVANEDYPDFIYALEYSNIIVEADGFIPLDDLIETYGPNIQKLYGDNLKRLRYSEEDPSIYFLGLPRVGAIRYEPERGFELQHIAVEAAGYPELKTLKDFEAVIRNYVDANPTINGKPTIGLSLLADDWRFKISITNPALAATGGPDDGEWYYNPETGKAMLHLRRDEEREYFRWLNHMYNTGLLDPESFVQKHDQYQAKISDGRVVGLADAQWQYVDAETELLHKDMAERTYGIYPLTLDDSYSYMEFRPESYSGGYGIGITSSCEDPVAAIKFMDWMCTEEAMILTRWGVEGIHYETIDGKRVFFEDVREQRISDPDFSAKTGVYLYTWPWPGYGNGVKDSGGDYFDPSYKESIINDYNEEEKKTLAAYGVETWKDLYPDESNFEPSPYGVLWQINIPNETLAAAIMIQYDELTVKRIPEAILTSPENFDNIWDSYMNELEIINVDLLEERFNRLIDKRIRLWNEE